MSLVVKAIVMVGLVDEVVGGDVVGRDVDVEMSDVREKEKDKGKYGRRGAGLLSFFARPLSFPVLFAHSYYYYETDGACATETVVQIHSTY